MQSWPIILVVVPAFVIVRHLTRIRREQRTAAAIEKKRDAFVALESEKRKAAFKPRVTVKEIVRPDGKAKARIFQRSEGTFGVVFDSWSDDGQCWMASFSPGTGAVYATCEIAEREIAVEVSWYRPHEKPE